MVTSWLFMHSPLPTTDLLAHSKALEAAGIAISLVMRVPELCFLNALPTWFSEARSPRVPHTPLFGPYVMLKLRSQLPNNSVYGTSVHGHLFRPSK